MASFTLSTSPLTLSFLSDHVSQQTHTTQIHFQHTHKNPFQNHHLQPQKLTTTIIIRHSFSVHNQSHIKFTKSVSKTSATGTAVTQPPPPPSQPWQGAAIKPLIASIATGIILWFVPVLDGVTKNAWQLLSIFLTTIVGIITQPLALGAVALMGLGASVLTKTLTFSAAFSALGDPIPWLIALAFFLARGFLKVGLLIFGGKLNVDAVTASILGLSVLLITGVVTWKECLAESVTWDTLTRFATLIAMAGYLNKYGPISWFSQTVVK